MNVYVLLKFTDHEGSEIKGVVTDEKRAREWTLREATKEREHENAKDIDPLPHGWKVLDTGFISEIFPLDTSLFKETPDTRTHTYQVCFKSFADASMDILKDLHDNVRKGSEKIVAAVAVDEDSIKIVTVKVKPKAYKQLLKFLEPYADQMILRIIDPVRLLALELSILDEELDSLEAAGIPRGWREYHKLRRHRKRIVQETLERLSKLKNGDTSLPKIVQELKDNARWLREQEKKKE